MANILAMLSAPSSAGSMTRNALAEVLSTGGARPVVPGNVNIFNRPKVQNDDGSVSTVRSMSFNVDGLEYLVPTVSDDGRIMSDDEAIQNFFRTGKHLGAFRTPEDATGFAERLHDQQASYYGLR